MLLAKYLEHQAVAMRRDFGHQRSRRQTRPTATACDGAESNDGVINGTGGEPGGFGNKACPAVRVLELGCGTGLAGLAAAYSFGRRETGHRGGDITAALSCPRQRSNTCGDESNGLVECASSPTVESGVEVLLTDLEYALENARSNIRRNASSLKALGNSVNAVELDWCRPLPDEFGGETMTPSWFPVIFSGGVAARKHPSLCMLNGRIFSAQTTYFATLFAHPEGAYTMEGDGGRAFVERKVAVFALLERRQWSGARTPRRASSFCRIFGVYVLLRGFRVVSP